MAVAASLPCASGTERWPWAALQGEQTRRMVTMFHNLGATRVGTMRLSVVQCKKLPDVGGKLGRHLQRRKVPPAREYRPLLDIVHAGGPAAGRPVNFGGEDSRSRGHLCNFPCHQQKPLACLSRQAMPFGKLSKASTTHGHFCEQRHRMPCLYSNAKLPCEDAA